MKTPKQRLGETESMKVFLIDGFVDCDNCGYTIRQGWRVNDETSQGTICGKCCPEFDLEPTAIAEEC